MSDLALEFHCLICAKPREGGDMLSYRLDGRDGLVHVRCLPKELALALSDTGFVYASLTHHAQALGEANRQAFERKARLIVAMAKYVGIAESLRWIEASPDEVEAALVELQKECDAPEGWPFGEFWLLREEDAARRQMQISRCGQQVPRSL